MGMHELYNLHTPFVIAFLVFVVIFALAQWWTPRGRDSGRRR